jgi:Coenzyme PQQ synthesis protein D (PqqD)
MDISQKRFTKRSDLVTRSITGETIIVPVQGHVGDLDSIYTLNEVGSAMWELIDGETSVSQIIDAVSREYEVTREESEADVIELIESLESAGLIS